MQNPAHILLTSDDPREVADAPLTPGRLRPESLALARPVGRHCIVELYGCPVDRLSDEALARDAIERAARAAGATLLELVSHRFQPHGVTALGLLGESHVSIHTWPETGFVAADLFTCGDACDSERAYMELVRAYAPRFHTFQLHLRGTTLRGPALCGDEGAP